MPPEEASVWGVLQKSRSIQMFLGDCGGADLGGTGPQWTISAGFWIRIRVQRLGRDFSTAITLTCCRCSRALGPPPPERLNSGQMAAITPFFGIKLPTSISLPICICPRSACSAFLSLFPQRSPHYGLFPLTRVKALPISLLLQSLDFTKPSVFDDICGFGRVTISNSDFLECCYSPEIHFLKFKINLSGC